MNAPTDAKFPPQLKDPKLFRQQGCINGAWLDADAKATINVTNPANGAVIGTIPKMGAAETRRAIEAASAALPACGPCTRATATARFIAAMGDAVSVRS